LKFRDGDPGGKAENPAKRECGKKMEGKSKPTCPDPVGACGTHSLPRD
jgi:hypothetical protein